MRTRNRLLPLFLLVLALAAPAVFSQDEPRQSPPQGMLPVQEADVNGDGRVTREEWSRAFDRYDANQDGVLTAAEIRAGARAVANPYAERFESLDRDHDGYISRAEWPLEPASFDRVDRDADGRLSRTELLTPNRDLTAGEPSRLNCDCGGTVTPNEYRNQAAEIEDTWRTRSTPRAQSRFSFLDRNSDNRISRLEWTGSRADFNRLDRNRDGVLSPYEWPAQ